MRKEEPKQRLEKYSERFDNDESAIGNLENWGRRLVKEEPKQETIEEAALLVYPIHLIWDEDERYDCSQELREAFIEGAKWQAERMYSEEEVIAFGEFIFKHTLLAHSKGVKNLFEQFKKK